MATLNTSVSLKSTEKVAGEFTLDFSQLTDNTFTDASGDNLSATGVATEIVSTGVAVNAYVYMKNTDNTNNLKLRDGAGNMFAIILPGEWMFFTLPASTGLKVETSAGTIVTNYIILKK